MDRLRLHQRTARPGREQALGRPLFLVRCSVRCAEGRARPSRRQSRSGGPRVRARAECRVVPSGGRRGVSATLGKTAVPRSAFGEVAPRSRCAAGNQPGGSIGAVRRQMRAACRDRAGRSAHLVLQHERKIRITVMPQRPSVVTGRKSSPRSLCAAAIAAARENLPASADPACMEPQARPWPGGTGTGDLPDGRRRRGGGMWSMGCFSGFTPAGGGAALHEVA